MVIYGLTTQPLLFVSWMAKSNLKFSFNKIKFLHKVVVFSSVAQLKIHSKSVGKRTVVVFDAMERLIHVENITLVDHSNQEKLQDFLQNKTEWGKPTKNLVVAKLNVIKKAITSNKDHGLLHTYNTNIYAIKAKDTREQLKNLIFDFVAGVIDIQSINKILNEFGDLRRGSSAKTVISNISTMLNSDQFNRTRTSVIALLKEKSQLDRDHIEKVSLLNKVEAYDVNYFYAKALVKRNQKK